MAANYYKEDIKRITEQALEQEILNDFDDVTNEITSIGEETEKTIWDSIKKEISNKGYRIVISDDRNGNVTVAMIKG